MTDRERLLIILVGSFLAIGVTAVVAWMGITTSDMGEKQLIIGGLIGTGAFGGGALFALIGASHKPQPMVEVQPPSTVNVLPAETPDRPA